MNYFSRNPDDWDPLVTDGFATDYDVILFNNAGVAGSGGETPGTVSEMTRHAVAFCDALGLKEFHVVGFSLGGMIAQQLALDHPHRVKRIFCSQRSGLAGGAGAPQPVRARPGVPRSKPTTTASRRAAPTTAQHDARDRVEETDGARLHQLRLCRRVLSRLPAVSRRRHRTMVRIRYREDFVYGLEKAPEAFIGMLEGRNFGKLIVRIDGGSKPRVRRQTGRIRHWCR
jgi:pimeloyl-ACP methyl ester carboxylesterase